MRRLLVFGLGIVGFFLTGCTGGAAGTPADDVGDIFVIGHSPGNGDELDTEDSVNGYNALDNVTLLREPGVAIIFSGSLDLTSVINSDPADPQGSRNVRLFYFDTTQGPYDPSQPTVPGVNPPGANVIVPGTTTYDSYNVSNDMLIITPTGITPNDPLPDGQYSVVVQQGVRGADGDGMQGAEYFFFFRVGQDNLGPVVVSTSPVPGAKNVEPDAEIRITMSETLLASTVNESTIKVSFQPAGAAAPTPIPGTYYTDGGNGPGNNYPNIQLDAQGIPGRSGVSPRNGVDIVFRPDLDAFPVNMTAEDWQDPFCTLISDPPRKGNKGMPLGQAITVSFVTVGTGVSDTAGNQIPAGSPNLSFTFETKPRPDAVYAPNNVGAIYYGDTVGVGVIDIDPARTPYQVGPNPPRQPNSVVTIGTGLNAKIVRVPVQDLVDMTSDTRPYSAFYSFVCSQPNVTFAMPVLYAASGAVGGGQIIVIDTFSMVSMGKFGTPSPGGVALTAVGNVGRLAVSNFSANTVTVYDIVDVRWFTGATLWATQNGLVNAVAAGSAKLILDEKDFKRVFPRQKQDLSSPPGPPVIGTINVGVSPTRVKITGFPNSLGAQGFPCYSPWLGPETIVCALNAGENTVDFTELQRLNQSQAIEPDLDGVNLSSQPTDVAWAPFSTSTGSYYFFITGIGGTVELFASGFIANSPSVRPGSASNFSPNKIINSITGLELPSAVQWIPTGTAQQQSQSGYTYAALIAETGRNQVLEVGVTAEFPTNLFQITNPSLVAGLGPVDLAGDPSNAYHFTPCGPRFSTYYAANAGQGAVNTGNYFGGFIGASINTPGVVMIVSWWSR
ncbi:MAG TPA: Ig-like domain-containing protein [Planctomycetota bacterium]|nr:Ig-like domain-containing protein [Planctomycetota bacterium]